MDKSKLLATFVLVFLLLFTACAPKATGTPSQGTQEQTSSTEEEEFVPVVLSSITPITNAIQIAGIDPPVANGLSINDPITVNLTYGLAEAQGQVQIWFESFQDDQCTQLGVNPGDPKGGSTLPGGIMQYVGAGNQEISISIPPIPPIGASFIGVGARLWNVDTTASLAEDMEYRYCYAAKAAEPVVPTPGQGAATRTVQIATNTPEPPENPPAPATGTVTGTVYSDDNSNGIQDPGEAGIPSMGIFLSDQSCIPTLGSTTTDANGNYTFSDLGLNIFHCVVIHYTGPGTVTPQIFSHVMFYEPGTATLSFGIQPPAPPPPVGTGTLNVTLYWDNDMDCRRAGEPVAPGLTVEIVDALDNVIWTGQTGPDGRVSAPLVVGLFYGVRIPAQAFCDGSTGDVAASVTSDGEIVNLNVLLQPSAAPPPPPTGSSSFLLAIFTDADGNTNYDSGTDTPLSGITVNLYNSGGTLLGSSTTSDGTVRFSNLPAGTYTLEAVGITNCQVAGCRGTYTLGEGEEMVVEFAVRP